MLRAQNPSMGRSCGVPRVLGLAQLYLGVLSFNLILLNRNLLPLTANSAVTIPAGVTVVVDVQLPQLTSITVDGTLVLRNLGTPQNIQVRGR